MRHGVILMKLVSYSVAQTCSLPHRRFSICGAKIARKAIGFGDYSRAFPRLSSVPSATRRYSILQICATTLGV